MDGIDAVVLRIRADEAEVLAARTAAYPEAQERRIRRLATAGTTTLEEFGELDVLVGRAFADAALAAIETAGLSSRDVRAIGSHGQTVRHRPDGEAPFTLQIGDPNVIAERTGIDVVGDFRRRDLAAGGQAAPLVPAFHGFLVGRPGTRAAVLNLGGIANLTLLDGEHVIGGFDTGPASTLMDAWCRTHTGRRYDEGGEWAAAHPVSAPLLEALLDEPYFERPPPKSTGIEHFTGDWLEARLARLERRPAPGVVASTLCELTVVTVARALAQTAPGASRLVVCGGGAHNRELMRRLEAALPGVAVSDTGPHGIGPDWIEAAAFAWLAHRRLVGRPGNVPAVTGARHAAVLGGVYSKA